MSQVRSQREEGFTPFEAAINGYAHLGKNRLTVAVNNIVDSTTLPEGNKKGVFMRERKPKMAAHYLRERWMSIPDVGYKS